MTDWFRFSPETTKGAELLKGHPEEVCAMLNEVMDRSEAAGLYWTHNDTFDRQAAFNDILSAYEELKRAGTPPASADALIAFLDGRA